MASTANAGRRRQIGLRHRSQRSDCRRHRTRAVCQEYRACRADPVLEMVVVMCLDEAEAWDMRRGEVAQVGKAAAGLQHQAVAAAGV
jgi:hypothetical protein